jgi:sugar (pentulose or hexulose) kinase
MLSDLTFHCVKSVRLVLEKHDETKKIFITGGFSRNDLFIRFINQYFHSKEIYTSTIDNASALGAAMVIYKSIKMGVTLPVILSLKKVVS